MPKVAKLGLAVLLPLVLIVVGFFALAKKGLIPTDALAAKSPALKMVFKLAGIKSKAASLKGKGLVSNAPDPLAGEKRQLQEQREQLAQERSEFEAQKQAEIDAKRRARTAVPVLAPPDPREIARLATVYEEMPAAAVTKIFAKLPDPYVVLLLRKMDEKQVGNIMAQVTPDRAAKLSTALSASATASETGGATTGALATSQ